jgi:hypothetical protein
VHTRAESAADCRPGLPLTIVGDQTVAFGRRVELVFDVGLLERAGSHPATELDELAKGIGRRQDPLAVPVTLSRDGQVVDGSQRLRALQLRGRKYIDATDVRILRRSTPTMRSSGRCASTPNAANSTSRRRRAWCVP